MKNMKINVLCDQIINPECLFFIFGIINFVHDNFDIFE
jgi:hypothetical protein